MISNYTSLSNQLLIAMPTLEDANFFQTVIYLCEHTEQGAMGIIINKPLDINLGEILRHLDITIKDKHVDTYPVLRGGPIAPEQGFLLHRQRSAVMDQADGVLVSASKQDLVQLASGEGLQDTLVSLGYAGWDAGQLEQELLDNAWLLVPANAVIIFETPFELRWRMAATIIGVDITRLCGDVGHA